MAESTEAFAGRLLEALPSLREAYEATAAEARAQGLGDVAAHFFLDDHTRRLLERFRDDPGGASPELTTLAAVLEPEYGADRDVDAVIDASFLALFPPAGADPDPAAALGAKLRAALDQRRSWRPDPAGVALVERLLGAVPALEPLARENGHGDPEGLLVHVFLGDVARRQAENVEAGRLAEPRAVLDVLEDEFGAGTPVDEPIAVSFVENLPYPDEPGAALVDLLGPKLRAELAVQRDPG
jgi:hypothetical protein